MEEFFGGKIRLGCGDSRDLLKTLPDNSMDSIVTCPPYALVSIQKRFGKAGSAPAQHGSDGLYARASAGFMGQSWDTGETAFAVSFWEECLRVLKPGGHLVAFSGTRTYHRMAVAIEDAGFEIRDQLAWMYGSGFPKSHDVSKGIDKAAGAERPEIGSRKLTGTARIIGGQGGASSGRADELYSTKLTRDSLSITGPATDAAREWQGWGTAIKPAWEPICLGRKPLSERTVAANVLRWGTGALNIDGCRIETNDGYTENRVTQGVNTAQTSYEPRRERRTFEPASGRWPANIITDGSDEVVGAFPDAPGQQRGVGPQHGAKSSVNVYGDYGPRAQFNPRNDSGSAARFFASFPNSEDECLSIEPAKNAESVFLLQSERGVSALSHAAELTMGRLALKNIVCPEQNTSVSERELSCACETIIEIIQNLERRLSLGLPLENITARLGDAKSAVTKKQTGIMTITVSLLRLDRFVEVATLNIMQQSVEVGAGVSASRFHYSAKADSDDRLGSRHPTVKPVDLMQWLVRLVTPKNGTVLDPFAGTGSTAEACFREGMQCVVFEREAAYQADIRRRMALCLGGKEERRRESIKAKMVDQPIDAGPLFGGMDTPPLVGRQIYGVFADEKGERLAPSASKGKLK